MLTTEDLVKIIPAAWTYSIPLSNGTVSVGACLPCNYPYIIDDFWEHKGKRFVSNEEFRIWCDMMNYCAVSCYRELIVVLNNLVRSTSMSA